VMSLDPSLRNGWRNWRGASIEAETMLNERNRQNIVWLSSLFPTFWCYIIMEHLASGSYEFLSTYPVLAHFEYRFESTASWISLLHFRFSWLFDTGFHRLRIQSIFSGPDHARDRFIIQHEGFQFVFFFLFRDLGLRKEQSI
jgi:hypothetical protein